MRLAPALFAIGAVMIAPVHAEQGDAVSWLQRIAVAAQKLNFTGTFSYQSGGNSETSRITHMVDSSGEHEKLEMLDGSPREVVRNNDEVKCYLPEEKMVIVERGKAYKAFPALLPSSVASLAESYELRKGEVARVAGLESQLIVLEPRDTLRYGHMLWADLDTGLLLKARMVNELNEPIEQFAFTQVQIGGNIDPEALKPKASIKDAEWRVQNARVAQPGASGGNWLFKTQLPGFKKSAGMRRQAARLGAETTHIVFSDGLASISVFIETLGDQPESAQPSTFSVGAINVYKRAANKHLFTLLGEVPPATLKRLGDGIEVRRK
jgi:sigma-E factor negative regulatory protein RseB